MLYFGSPHRDSSCNVSSPHIVHNLPCRHQFVVEESNSSSLRNQNIWKPTHGVLNKYHNWGNYGHRCWEGHSEHLGKEDKDLKSLESDYARLRDEAQRLISERIQLENELAGIKKRASRLDEEVRILKNPPLIVGHLQDILDDERAIVRSSNGTVFQVSINQRLSKDRLRPGTRVALNQDTLSVIEILHDAWDQWSLVQK